MLPAKVKIHDAVRMLPLSSARAVRNQRCLPIRVCMLCFFAALDGIKDLLLRQKSISAGGCGFVPASRFSNSGFWCLEFHVLGHPNITPSIDLA